jgi:DNA-binding NtrC family response regulator
MVIHALTWHVNTGPECMLMPANASPNSDLHTASEPIARRAERIGPMSAADRASVEVLLVESDPSLRETCAKVLGLDGYSVTVSGDGQEALDLVMRRSFDVLVTDVDLAKVDGMTLMARALAVRPDTIAVMMTDNPSVDSSIDAQSAGAWDYLAKPLSAAQLRVVVGRAAYRVLDARRRYDMSPTVGDGAEAVPIIGVSAGVRQAVDLAARVAASDASVFISGESGSGKELVARFIHENSRRRRHQFVAVNCAALPEALLESEMFGHCRGAFTGAVRDKPGLLEAADGGTLFLDELTELPKPAQAKLLRVIQDGVVRRVGSEATDAVVNVRFISATNGDLEAARRDGILREDLYYRLRVVPIHLPALRERPEDVPVLADHFLQKFWRRRGLPPAHRPSLSAAAIDALASYSWPGNVRELQNVIEHATVLAEPGAKIGPDDLLLGGKQRLAGVGAFVGPSRGGFGERYHEARERVLTEFETQYLTWLVDRAEGNLSEAARIAGVDRTTLYRVMERHGWRRPHNARGWTPMASHAAIPEAREKSPAGD